MSDDTAKPEREPEDAAAPAPEPDPAAPEDTAASDDDAPAPAHEADAEAAPADEADAGSNTSQDDGEAQPAVTPPQPASPAPEDAAPPATGASEAADDDADAAAEASEAEAVTDTTSARVADPDSARARVGRWLRRVLGREPFEVPDANPAVGTTPSASPWRVEAPREVDDWDDEWDAPVVTDDPWTPPTTPKAKLLRWDSDRTRTWLGLGLVVLLTSLVYIPFIGTFGLWDPWEVHYGEASRHMTETNDWISPWWGSHWSRPGANPEGSGFFSKPILLLWAMALGLEVWGWTEFAIRIGVALMSIAAVSFTYMAGASVWNRRTGFFMAMVLATAPFFFFVGRQAQTDMPFVAMMTCAMALFLMGAFGKDRRKPADLVHYGLFFGTLLILVLPQLWLIGTDSGFSEAQRALRPGLRPNSMLDFKAEKVLDEFVFASTPHLSPAERDTLSELPPAEYEARLADATSGSGDWTFELTAPLLAVGFALAGILAMLVLGLRGQLGARLMRDKTNRLTTLALIAMALLAQALALAQQVNRLYEAWGANWEGQFGTAFNLVKFSGIGLSLLMLAATAGLLVMARKAWRLEDALAAAPDDAALARRLGSARLGFFGLTGALVAILFVSPIFLVLKAKALGVDGLSFWLAEDFPPVRLVKIVLGSVYAPLVLGLFLIAALIVFFSARSAWWRGRNAIALWSIFALLASTIFMCVSVFYIPITLDGKLETFGKVAGKVVGAMFQWGPVQIALYLGCMVIVAVSLATSKRKTVGQLCFMGFYIFAALATMAKGLLGFALPGAIIFFYLVATVEWKRLLEFEVPRGLLVFIAVGVPWYAAMLILHEKAYWDRFFVHDHFKRLASGVHAIDDGTFEHFIKWLAYGLFPWTALVPAALIRLGSGRGLLRRDDRSRATLVIGIWASFAFALFSLSSTKFHHYTFPVVPALCMLVALLLSEIWSGRMKRMGPLILSALAVLALVGWDLYLDPQHWKNLFTYKYDREWIDLVPEFTATIFGQDVRVRGADLHRSFQLAALGVALLAGAGLLLMIFRTEWLRRTGVLLLGTAATLLAYWGLDVYMPGISPTWSQREVWMAYWDECTKIPAPPEADEKKIWCEESSLVYRITWRGEHYYSQNESIPLQNDDDFRYFVEYNGTTPFYIMVDRARYCGGSEQSPNFGRDCTASGAIVGEVRKFYKDLPVDHELTWDENLKFVMVKFYPAGKPDPAATARRTTRAAVAALVLGQAQNVRRAGRVRPVAPTTRVAPPSPRIEPNVTIGEPARMPGSEATPPP